MSRFIVSVVPGSFQRAFLVTDIVALLFFSLNTCIVLRAVRNLWEHADIPCSLVNDHIEKGSLPMGLLQAVVQLLLTACDDSTGLYSPRCKCPTRDPTG